MTYTVQQYHSDPAPEPSLSSSIAKILLTQSPLHAWMAHPRLNPNYVPEESSRFDIGTAAHAVLLERDASRIVIVDADDWRTKAAKEERDAAREYGKLALLRKDHDNVLAMTAVAHKTIEQTELAGIFANGSAEETLIWRESDIYCRSRMDWISTDRKVILDYKTTDSAEPDTFIRQIARMGYDMQAEFYRRGETLVNGSNPTFVFLAQEISPPYACSLVALSNTYCELAQAKVAQAIHIWQRCLATGEWPGYSTHIHYAEPPAWAQAEFANKEF
jgi:hypothetical protein